MKKAAWTPWHKVVKLREDVRSGELSLAVFAADLYDVVLGRARPVYQDPREFFALTYPTFNLRELTKDVAVRLAGKNDRAIRQLELTYGGGKTHTLITLYHLVHDPAKLPNLPAVQEFTQHIGFAPTKARIAILPFDKLDAEKGMEVSDPSGKLRWLKHPWSVLAWEIAGSDGLRLLNADGKDEERESAPAENLLVQLISLPQKQDLSTLVLIDEVLMFVREKVGLDPTWRGRIVNFFQYLTQAATKVDRCAIVASLLATDPRKSDPLGKELSQELYSVFRREREEGVQPVLKDDVAEVLRRRFFSVESIRDREAFRPHVVAAVRGIADLDELTQKDLKATEDRFLRNYPFHPELTEVFYTKWTNLDGFQRTRGVLRTFALALRDAERWDESPLVAANVFLGEAGRPGLSEGARELTTVAATEEYEGRKQEWTAILEGELSKAREIQGELPALKGREVEQAVVATFLHSQPIGQKALTRDLMLLLGHGRPDKIELEKAMRRWIETSWFLDEGAIQDVDTGSDAKTALPKSWRLGSKPNLRQMHHDACIRVPPELIEAKLVEEIQKTKSLTSGASAVGARVHVLPDRPKDVEDDGDFHYAVLGPKAVSESGKPSAEATRFINETTSADRPRAQNGNAVVLATPSRDGLDLARQRIREYLGWEEVRAQLKGQEIDPIREGTLNANIETSRKRVPDSIAQAYCIIVTLSEKNEVQAFKVTPGDEPLFQRIKGDRRARIEETAVSAEAVLPGGPYDLWHEGDTARRVKDLVGAFAQIPRLPKMLNRRAILDTLIQGCRDGLFLLRVTRADRSTKSYWREAPSEPDVKEPTLEVVLPEAGTLGVLSGSLLIPGALPGLWSTNELTIAQLRAYFSGGTIIKVPREGYEEPFTIPRAPDEALEAAVGEAVRAGQLWLVAGAASLLGEEVPAGLMDNGAVLQPPPSPLPPTDVLPSSLPEAWKAGTTTALALADALSVRFGKPLPWSVARSAIDAAIRSRLLEPTANSGSWPCDVGSAQSVFLHVPAVSQRPTPPPPAPPPTAPGVLVAEGELRVAEIQELSEQVNALRKAAVGLDIRFRIRIEIGGGKQEVSDETARKLDEILAQVSDGLKLS